MREPEIPVTVALYVPGAAVLLAVRVMALFPVVGLGLIKAVTPVGNPAKLKRTLPLKPVWDTTVT